jgi:hypothetical protein
MKTTSPVVNPMRKTNLNSQPRKLSRSEFAVLNEVSEWHDAKSASDLSAISVDIARNARNVRRAANIVRRHPCAWKQYARQGGHIYQNGCGKTNGQGAPVVVECETNEFKRLAKTAPRAAVNPPLAGRITRLFSSDADVSQLVQDGHVWELVANFPGVQIFKDAHGYIVDREVLATFKVNGTGDYAVRHQRIRVDPVRALQLLLAAVVPTEFLGMIGSLFESPANGSGAVKKSQRGQRLHGHRK